MDKLSLMIVEDERIAAEDLKAQLHHLGYNVVAIVDSGEDAIERAADLRPDMILMDIQLKGEMNGITAAQNIRTQYGIPIVFLTAYADKHTLEAAKKTEPYGFIIKPYDGDQLHGVIETATYKHKMECKLRESEARNRELMEISFNGIIIHREGSVVYVNTIALNLFGAKESEELIGKPILDFVPAEYREQISARIQQARKMNKAVPPIEEKFIRLDGTTIDVEVMGVPIIYDDQSAIQVVFRDISDRKKAESALRESEERFRRIFEEGPLGVVLVDLDLRISFANELFCKMMGYENEEAVGLHINDTIDPDSGDPDHQLSNELFSGERSTFQEEEKFIRKDGQRIWVRLTGTILHDDDQNPLYILGMVEDITERKQAAEALRIEQDFNSTIIQRSPAFFVAINADGTIRMMNEVMLNALKYSEDEVLGKNYMHMFVPKMNHDSTTLIFDSLLQGVTTKNENHVMTKDGRELLVEWLGTPIFNDAQKLDYFFGVGVDITERKRAEKALQKSENKYRTLLENLPQKIFAKDKNSVYLSCNTNYASDLSINLEEIVGKTDYDFYPKDLADTYRADDMAIMESGEIVELEEKYLKDGKELIVRTIKVPLKDDKGNITGIQGIFVDITERKAAELKLRERFEFEKMLSGLSATLISIPSNQLREKVENGLEQTATFLGIDRCSIIEFSENKDKFRISHSYSAPGIESIREFAFEKVTPWYTEKMKIGESVIFERIPEDVPKEAYKDLGFATGLKQAMTSYVSIPLRIGGEVVGAIGATAIRKRRAWPEDLVRRLQLLGEMLMNAISRNRWEKTLRESEERNRLLIENIPTVVWASNQEGETIYISPNVEKVYGYTPEEIYNQGDELWIKRIHPDETKRVKASIERLFSRGETYDVEYRIQRKDGQWIWLQDRASVTREINGELYAYGVFSDITERRKAVEALRDSEERFRRIFEEGPLGMVLVDLNSKITMLNDICCRMLGQTKEKLIGISTRDIWHPDDVDLDHQFTKKLFSGNGISIHGEGRMIRNDGQIIWVHVTGTAILDNDGKPLYSIAMLEDITERKRIEDTLNNTLAELEQMKDRLQEESIYLREEIKLDHNFEEIIGESQSLKHVLHDVELAAQVDSTVLILGETGTGKELIARAIHNYSSRKDRPLVKVNCAALPVNLIESELFGHEKGAFTGATTLRRGRFELAEGGSLFLDEIGDLPLDLQTKLLRVLQEGEFERVGGDRTIKVDVRIITATNRDLKQLISKEKFRRDLYFRLNVFSITAPALRERLEDIPMLAKYFAGKYGLKVGKEFKQISKKTMDALQSLNWPGNIRELENVIERAAIFSKSPTLQVDSNILKSMQIDENEIVLGSLEETERDHILHVLENTRWIIEGDRGAAKVLDINPSTLRSRMKKLGIQKPR